jgi:hypothetical protein
MSAAPQQSRALDVLCFRKKYSYECRLFIEAKVRKPTDTCISEIGLTWTQRQNSPQVQLLVLDTPLILHLTVPRLSHWWPDTHHEKLLVTSHHTDFALSPSVSDSVKQPMLHLSWMCIHITCKPSWEESNHVLALHYILVPHTTQARHRVQQFFPFSHCGNMFILPTVVSSDSTNLAFRRQVIFNSKVIWRCVFYAVRFISNTQYVVKESRQTVLPRTSWIFRNNIRLKIWYTFLFHGIKLIVALLYKFLPWNFKMTMNN